MLLDEELREMVLTSTVSTVALSKKAREKGMRTLREDGVEKALAGITSIEEIARVCEEQVEIKSDTTEQKVERIVKPEVDFDSKQKKEVPEVSEVSEVSEVPQVRRASASAIDDYQKRIAGWLSRKK